MQLLDVHLTVLSVLLGILWVDFGQSFNNALHVVNGERWVHPKVGVDFGVFMSRILLSLRGAVSSLSRRFQGCFDPLRRYDVAAPRGSGVGLHWD